MQLRLEIAIVDAVSLGLNGIRKKTSPWNRTCLKARYGHGAISEDDRSENVDRILSDHTKLILRTTSGQITAVPGSTQANGQVLRWTRLNDIAGFDVGFKFTVVTAVLSGICAAGGEP